MQARIVKLLGRKRLPGSVKPELNRLHEECQAMLNQLDLLAKGQVLPKSLRRKIWRLLDKISRWIIKWIW